MIKGNLVGLRAIERYDLTILLEWRNRPDYRRYFREHRELGMDQQQAWFEKVVIGDPGTRMFAIDELASGRLLGACGLCYINWVDRNADFSIYVGADGLYIDDRFAPEAAELMVSYGFGELGLHRLWAEVYAFDEKKRLFFERLGFSLDGRFRETHWSGGVWHDSLYYALLASDNRVCTT